MAVTVNVAGIFPDGTSVGAYGTATQPSDSRAAPSGSPVATATVASGSLSFSGLTEDASYLAIAQVSGSWVRHGFIVNEIAAGHFLDGVEIATQASLDTEAEARADADDAIDADIAVVGETLNLLTNSATDQATTLQTACDNIESQGGGKVLLPATDYSGLGITLSSRVDVGMAVDLQGHGKRGTKFRLNHADAGLYFVGSSDAGYSGSTNRGGKSGNFHIDGNGTATNPLIIRSTNRAFKDIRVSTPANNGTAIKLDGCQNCNFFSIEAEDGSHSSSRTVIGILLDGAACGNNFFGTSLNEFTAGHIVFDASYDAPSALGIDYSNNNVFVGNMIERSDTYNPIIYAKAGANNHFIGGNITSGGSVDSNLAAEYDLVKFDNTAARSYATIGGSGAPTRDFSFRGISFTGTIGSGSATFANAFRLVSGVQTWHRTVTVDPSCTFDNCKYLGRVDSVSAYMDAQYPDDKSGGGLTGYANPSGSGVPNRVGIASAGTLTIQPTWKNVQVTGSTTITSIGATYPGHFVTLGFTSTAQVTDGSNLVLNGDFTGSGNRTLELRCDGTNWIERSRCAP